MKTPEQIIEDGYVEMYRGFFRLRKAKKFQEEYDAMGTVISLLMKDRQYLREKYHINP